MYLVDTSVWVDFIAGRDEPHVGLLRDLLSNPLAVHINHLIYVEILQGARNPASFARLKDYFDTQRFVAFEQPREAHAAAARMYVDCRRRGVTIRSTIDCLIAQSAMDSDLTLLHNDRDFGQIAAVAPELRQRSFLG